MCPLYKLLLVALGGKMTAVLVRRSVGSRCSLFVLLIALCVLFSGGLVQADSPACRLVVVPATARIALGQVRTLDVRVEDVQNLYAYQCYIDYDPGVLQVRDADPSRSGIQVHLGDFLQADFVQQNSVDATVGRIAVVITQINPTPAVSGSGVLFSVDFVGAAVGSSSVRADRTQTIITNRDAEVFQVTYEDAEIVVTSTRILALPIVRR